MFLSVNLDSYSRVHFLKRLFSVESISGVRHCGETKYKVKVLILSWRGNSRVSFNVFLGFVEMYHIEQSQGHQIAQLCYLKS